MIASHFVQLAIDQQLRELRKQCALARLVNSQAFGPRWASDFRDADESRNGRGLRDAHWDKLQANAQDNAVQAVKRADSALALFIQEHREIMPPDWVESDHGRLCWNAFLGVAPVRAHFCQLPEGHDGAHGDGFIMWGLGPVSEPEPQGRAA